MLLMDERNAQTMKKQYTNHKKGHNTDNVFWDDLQSQT